jgi:hypothetical protein
MICNTVRLYKHIYQLRPHFSARDFKFYSNTLNVCGTTILNRPSHLHVHFMDQPRHMDQSLGEYLHQNRSTSASFVTESRFENQGIAETKIDAASRVNTPSSTSIPSLSNTVNSESEGSPFVSGPTHYITQSRSGQAVSDQNWTYLHSSRVVDSPVPFIEEPRGSASARILTPRIIRESPPADMTTLGVQFDPQFDPVARSSYTWPRTFTHTTLILYQR